VNDLDALRRRFLGATTPPRSEVADLSLARRWARAVGLDEDLLEVGAPVPTTFVQCLAQPPIGPAAMRSEHDPSEPVVHWLLPVEGRALNAGDEIQLDRPVLVGETVTRTSEIRSIEVRPNRRGALRLWVSSLTTYRVDDETRVRWTNSQVVLLDELPHSSPRPEGPVAPPPSLPRRAQPGDPALVRRIGRAEIARFCSLNEELVDVHLDDDAARAHGLPGAIVPGWLKLGLVASAVDAGYGLGAAARLEARYVGLDGCGAALAVVTDGPAGDELAVSVCDADSGVPSVTGTVTLRSPRPGGSGRG
jgi:acyl dehydratase